ncbi:hypothetical protein KIM372_17090 [Bombiscardovia nodaiensis]|uniref:Uncharacterized protein n=1 Tax=Bombiscardovia nodaiensis TaxID=2932181 RepID=A0ABM8BA49_9BIFI|nr:hypothetical protein KIM372_17090 [Bombiscardovia nodaiensis]
MLKVVLAPTYIRDVKKLRRNHANIQPLLEVTHLVATDTVVSKAILKQRHKAHALQGKQYSGAYECHVANAGDWLLVWRRLPDAVVLLRTGKHDQVFQ